MVPSFSYDRGLSASLSLIIDLTNDLTNVNNNLQYDDLPNDILDRAQTQTPALLNPGPPPLVTVPRDYVPRSTMRTKR